jgi:hypothetical protein
MHITNKKLRKSYALNIGKMQNFKKNEIKILLTQNQKSDTYLVAYDKCMTAVLTSIAGS